MSEPKEAKTVTTYRASLKTFSNLHFTDERWISEAIVMLKPQDGSGSEGRVATASASARYFLGLDQQLIFSFTYPAPKTTNQGFKGNPWGYRKSRSMRISQFPIYFISVTLISALSEMRVSDPWIRKALSEMVLLKGMERARFPDTVVHSPDVKKTKSGSLMTII